MLFTLKAHITPISQETHLYNGSHQLLWAMTSMGTIKGKQMEVTLF